MKTAIPADVIGRLKRAAIDAYMHGQAVPGLGVFTIVGDDYLLASPGMTMTVRRPSAEGKGGGEGEERIDTAGSGISTTHKIDLSPQFAAVGAEIDALLDPWRELPDPDAIGVYVETCRTVTSRLSRSGWSDGDGNHRGAGVVVDSSLREIDAGSSDFTGETATSFRRKFLFAIPAVLESHLSLTITRGGAMLAQQKLWERAREDILSIVDSATNSMKAIAGSGDGTKKTILQVVGVALDGLRLFAPGAVGTAIDLGKLATGAATNALPDSVTLKAATYDAAMSLLQSALSTLSGHIAEEETTILKAVQMHRDASRDAQNRASYDLGEPELPGSNVFGYDGEALGRLARTVMPELATELNDIADLNRSCSSYMVVLRDGSIGMGAYGPGDDIDSFDTYIHNLLEEVAADILDRAVQLTLCLEDFAESEADVIGKLNKLYSGIDHIADDRPADPFGTPAPTPHAPLLPGAPPPAQNSWLDLLMGGNKNNGG